LLEQGCLCSSSKALTLSGSTLGGSGFCVEPGGELGVEVFVDVFTGALRVTSLHVNFFPDLRQFNLWPDTEIASFGCRHAAPTFGEAADETSVTPDVPRATRTSDTRILLTILILP
jgi:hypothetical protein